MSRYIDAEWLMQNINTTFWSQITKTIDSAPSIDIVYCEDCEHYEDNYCRKHDELIEPNEWCSFGERIDNE